MTPFEGAVLLLGIFGFPLVLLVKTQRFRDLGKRLRGAFWGGVAGYMVGLVIWSAALMLPLVMWDPGSARLAGVVLPLLACGTVGVGVGALIGREPRKRKRRKKKAVKQGTKQPVQQTSEG